MKKYDLIIIGAGPAGMLCAVNAKREGINNILLIDKDPVLGGSLNNCSCIIDKNGKITGEQYKEKLIAEFNKLDIEVLLNTMVLKIDDEGNVICLNSVDGLHKRQAQKIILCNGAKEKGRNSVAVTGDRCSGIFNVTMAKKIFDMDMVPGKNILFCGDDGIKRILNELKENDLNVAGIIGENSYDLNSILYSGYTLSEIKGDGRVEEAVITDGKESITVKCDTVIFAYEKISDGIVSMRSGIALNSLTTGPKVDENYMTSRENIYACGDGIYIHQFIEEIEEESLKLIEQFK